MECLLNQKNSRELAAFLLEKTKKDAVIPELFDLFGFHRICRSSVDPNLLDDLIRLFEDSGCCSEDILTQIIDLIRQGKEPYRTTENALLSQIDQYLDRHLNDDLQMEQMAEALHISYHYLFHFFKQKTGMPPSAFLNRKRLEKAVHMLTETDAKISDIAFRCGFNSSSYFTALFKRQLGKTPSAFRRDHSNTHFLDFYHLEDMLLATKIDYISILDEPIHILPSDCAEVTCLSPSDDEFRYQHNSVITVYQDTLFTCWCSSLTIPPQINTAIHSKRSHDGGKTWSEREAIASAPAEGILLSSAQFGVCGSNLYLFCNEILDPDTILSLVLHRLNPNTDRFEQIWSRPSSFRPTSKLITLQNGKLLMAGYSGRLFGYPNIPVVMISDGGDVNGEWREVPIATDGALPNGSKLTLPNVSLILCGDTLYAFCRNDMRRVPLVYLSHDFGETWSNAVAYDLPTTRTPIYGGTLSNGQNYLIANADRFNHKFDRSRLCIYFSKENAMQFDRKLVLFDTEDFPIRDATDCHCTSAAEHNGKLYVTATLNDATNQFRDICLFTIDLDKI